MRASITGTGSYVPDKVRSNQNFAFIEFYNDRRQRITSNPVEIIDKFEQITGIARPPNPIPGISKCKVVKFMNLPSGPSPLL